MLYSPYFINHSVTYYLEIASYALLPFLLIIQLTLGIISSTLVRSYTIIEGIRFGKKIDQLIFIAQKTHFQDRIRLGRRIYAIAALADIGFPETISHLEKLAQDKKANIRKYATLAIAEISNKVSSNQESDMITKKQNEPYKDNKGNYVSLFGLEKKYIRNIVINLITGLFIMIFLLSIILSNYDLSQIAFNLDYFSLFLLFTLMIFYTIFISYLLLTVMVRMNKIRRCIETNDVISLIRIAMKSGFNVLRYVKIAAISGLGDIGSTESNNILHNFSMDRKFDIQSRAITSLDMISIKNDQEKRFYLEFI